MHRYSELGFPLFDTATSSCVVTHGHSQHRVQHPKDCACVALPRQFSSSLRERQLLFWPGLARNSVDALEASLLLQEASSPEDSLSCAFLVFSPVTYVQKSIHKDLNTLVPASTSAPLQLRTTAI